MIERVSIYATEQVSFPDDLRVTTDGTGERGVTSPLERTREAGNETGSDLAHTPTSQHIENVRVIKKTLVFSLTLLYVTKKLKKL